jgi:hypothetical protein
VVLDYSQAIRRLETGMTMSGSSILSLVQNILAKHRVTMYQLLMSSMLPEVCSCRAECIASLVSEGWFEKSAIEFLNS